MLENWRARRGQPATRHRHTTLELAERLHGTTHLARITRTAARAPSVADAGAGAVPSASVAMRAGTGPTTRASLPATAEVVLPLAAN